VKSVESYNKEEQNLPLLTVVRLPTIPDYSMVQNIYSPGFLNMISAVSLHAFIISAAS